MHKKIPWLILSIGLSLGAGLIGSFFTISSIPTWYNALNKPSFSPPNYIFGPVWTTLYLLMGAAAYLVWITKGKGQQKAINLYFIQLALNVFWSIIFFGLRNPTAALIDVIALWIAIVLTIKSFYPLSKTAAYLLIPYILWVSFALVLNFMIVLLN